MATAIPQYLMVVLLVAVLLPACGSKSRSSEQMDDLDDMDMPEGSLSDDEEELTDELLEEEPVPLAAEELFDDFFFLFASNRKLQMERIALTSDSSGGVVGADSTVHAADDSTARIAWQMNHFFMNQDYYTVIFDRPEFMAFGKDTTVSEAVVEHIDFSQESVDQYLFDRQQGLWMLRKVVRQTIDDNPNASFLRFYHRFVTDSAFQRESLADEIEFHGADPDDEFNELDGLITPDFWDAFAPELPQQNIYNIVYDRHQDIVTRQKIFVLRGISNGSELELTFSKEQDAWKLKKLME